MSIDKGDFDSISENDLIELINAQVPEGLRLDYKLTAYGRTDSEKRELLKDISAFANSQGGHLILGIEEHQGTAVALPGLDIDSDVEILRMEQISRNAIEPRIPGIRIKQIPLNNSQNAIVVRIPRSWIPPHRVTAQGTNRFYMRHSAGVHEPSVEELRALFTESETALQRARAFHRSRIAEIAEGEGHRPLVGNGRLILHLLPVAGFSSQLSVDLEMAHHMHNSFTPIGAAGMNMGFNFYGYLTDRGGDENHGYTQLFRNGSLEATMGSIVRDRDGRQTIPGLGIEQYFFQRIEAYINGLRDLGIPVPIIALISLEGVAGAHYAVIDSFLGDEQPPLPSNLLELTPCVIEEYGNAGDYCKAFRPAFDNLWNAIGYSKSRFFDENDVWVGNRNGR